jgi:hypothetical protein
MVRAELTEEEEEVVRRLRQQLRDNKFASPAEEKALRDQLDRLYFKHKPRLSVSA